MKLRLHGLLIVLACGSAAYGAYLTPAGIAAWEEDTRRRDEGAIVSESDRRWIRLDVPARVDLATFVDEALMSPSTVHFRIGCDSWDNLTLEEVRARQYSGPLWVAVGDPPPRLPPQECKR